MRTHLSTRLGAHRLHVMSAVYLPVYVQNALEDNLELLPHIRAGAPQRKVLAFCQNFRIAGIGKLFLDGAPDSLYLHLHQSGRAFAHFLAHAPEDTLLGSKALPFFDAFAAGDFQLEVCKALLEAREEALNAALEQYLEARSDAWKEQEDNGSAAPEAFVTEGRFSVEGLSLVRMAERQGLATEPDYLHIPSLARKGRPTVFDARSWERIEVDAD